MQKKIIAIALLSIPAAFADAPQSLLSMVIPSNPMAREVVNRKIDIFTDGTVMKTTVRFNRTTTELPKTEYAHITTLKSGMAEVVACMADVETGTLTTKPSTCADDPGVHYVGVDGVKEFAVKYCDALQVVSVPCAKSMVDLLNALERVSRYQ